jgi:hypothetical protein
MQASPLRQSRDTYGGGGELFISVKLIYDYQTLLEIIHFNRGEIASGIHWIGSGWSSSQSESGGQVSLPLTKNQPHRPANNRTIH